MTSSNGRDGSNERLSLADVQQYAVMRARHIRHVTAASRDGVLPSLSDEERSAVFREPTDWLRGHGMRDFSDGDLAVLDAFSDLVLSMAPATRRKTDTGRAHA